METVIILGSGCAGLTAAIYAARANLKPLVIEGTQPGGQLTTTSDVENFPGFPEGINGYDLMAQMRKQAARFGACFVSDQITRVELSAECKRLHGQATVYETKGLIVATGASPRLLNVPGEKEFFGGKGVTTCATCDGAFYREQEVIVVGGGDSACEEALFLTRFCTKISLIHRRDTLRASNIMAERLLKHPKIQPIWDSAVESILGDEKGCVRAVKIQNIKTHATTELACKGVFIAVGHMPNTQAFAGILKLDDLGYLVPEAGSQIRTQVPGVYIAGDCADHVYRQAMTAAGMGCQASIELERWLAEQ